MFLVLLLLGVVFWYKMRRLISPSAGRTWVKGFAVIKVDSYECFGLFENICEIIWSNDLERVWISLIFWPLRASGLSNSLASWNSTARRILTDSHHSAAPSFQRISVLARDGNDYHFYFLPQSLWSTPVITMGSKWLSNPKG